MPYSRLQLIGISVLISISLLGGVSSVAHSAPSDKVVSITRVVGEVGEHIVTSREVRISDAIDQVLNDRAPGPNGFRILSGEESGFITDVSEVLNEWVVYLEAKSLSTSPAARGDVSKVMKAIDEKWGKNSSWIALEVSNAEVRTMVERKLVAREFERLKSDPSLAPISDEEARDYFNKNRLRFGNLPFESFKDNIKSFLVKQQTERRLLEWHEVLRRKYKVRNFLAG